MTQTERGAFTSAVCMALGGCIFLVGGIATGSVMAMVASTWAIAMFTAVACMVWRKSHRDA